MVSINIIYDLLENSSEKVRKTFLAHSQILFEVLRVMDGKLSQKRLMDKLTTVYKPFLGHKRKYLFLCFSKEQHQKQLYLSRNPHSASQNSLLDLRFNSVCGKHLNLEDVGFDVRSSWASLSKVCGGRGLLFLIAIKDY